ncbi:outer membrane protein assembly factor BamE domain-containing protein [Crateriforma conspicua]|uniref:outer membrane protein assembly factor BamE domain-containing protein n=1 Tax=Crateriforma conspicua TaxID=2527996 RepID=UPI0011A7D589|nr:outer membrane protein assembly factor BamE [Crateriforma conspicua]
MRDTANPYDSSTVESPHKSSGAQDERHTRTGLLLTFAAILLIPIVASYILVRPAVDRSLLSRITTGMPRAQVSTILGTPNDTEGPSQWEYWRWGNAGWVEIAFDDAGNVLWVNDESAFP